MKFMRVGICTLLVLGVAFHGGVEEWACAVLETMGGLLFLVWAAWFYFRRQEQVVLSSLLAPFIAFALVVLGQWFFRKTASTYGTRIEFLLLLTDLIVLFLSVQAFHTVENWREFFWFGMFFGFAVSFFGILQHLSSNGKIYWFREIRSGVLPSGPYVNRNHFAGFAELILPLALVPIVMGRVRKKRWPLVGLLAIVPIAALFLSGSRGGIVSFGTELAVLTLILALRGTKGKRLVAGAAILVGALLLVAWLGMGQIVTRLSSLRSVEVTEAKRASMYRDTWRIFLDHPWWGTGLGTLQIVYPPYETLYDGKVVNHTHNDYLEALAETGLLGGVCCAWFLAVLARAAWRQVREPHSSFAGTLQLSGLVACSGFLTHSLVDFNLHIPANALLFLLMAHLTTAQIPGPGSPSSPSEPRHRNP